MRILALNVTKIYLYILFFRMAKFQLNILGCGSAKPSPRHQPSSQVIDFRESLYMIDCGEGAQSMFAKMHLNLNRLNHIFISHLHGDHVFGLMGLVSTLALQGKGNKLTIHMFKDGAELFGSMFRYFCREIPFEIEFDVIEYGNKVIVEDENIRISTLPLKHRVPTVGFLFEEKLKQRHIDSDMAKFHNVPIAWMKRIKDGEDFVKEDGTVIPNAYLTRDPDPSISYAYCSDTMPTAKLLPLIENVDWLYHESTFASDNNKRAKETFHSTAEQAAEVARKVNAKNLILGHYSSRYKDESVLLNEAKAIFPNTTLANEGLRIDFIK